MNNTLKNAAIYSTMADVGTSTTTEAMELAEADRYSYYDEPQAEKGDMHDEKALRKSEFRGFKDDSRRFQNMHKHKMKRRMR